MILAALFISAAGFFTIGTDSSGLSAIIRPDGSPMYLSGVEHLYKKRAHEFANTNWEAEVVSRMKVWSFTSLGAGPTQSLRRRGMPYTQIAWIAESMTTSTNADDYVFPQPGAHAPCSSFPNVYSPQWEEKARAWAVRAAASFRDDADLIGWYLDNELRWFGVGNVLDNFGLYRAFAALDGEHSGRKALDAFLAERGQTVSNATEAVQLAFVEDVCERFFSVACRAMRSADPDHLILGVRFAQFAAPNAAWRSCGKWCDAVSLNVYPWVVPETGEVIRSAHGTNLRKKFDEKYALCRKPMIVTEWGVTSIDSGLPCIRGVGQRTRTQRERTITAERILYEFLAMPYLVGHNWYRYRDNSSDGGDGRENCNWGLVDQHGVPYADITAMLARVNADAVRLHREFSLEGRPIPYEPNFKGVMSASEVSSTMESANNAAINLEVGKRTPVGNILWDGKDYGFVDLCIFTRSSSGKRICSQSPRTVESGRGADGSLVVTSELRSQRDDVALRFVTRWKPDGGKGRFLGELVSIQNLGERDKTISSFMFHLVPPFASVAAVTNSAYTNFLMVHPLCDAAWIAPDGAFAGAVSCAPLANVFNFHYKPASGDGKGWPQPDAEFRLVDFGKEEPLLRPGQTWTSDGRIWAMFAFGEGGFSGWYDFRDAFEMKHIGALSRIPARFPEACHSFRKTLTPTQDNAHRFPATTEEPPQNNNL